ncbi:MAG TPA: AI-2E family transporter [Pyrinomonadaceae bacterium]|nr:AI-2E family transporter [Pyrinomonadaceae bacterium]
MELQETKETARSVAKAAAEYLLQTRTILRVVLIALLAYYFIEATRWVIIKVTSVLLLLVLAIFFAYLVSPLVEFLSRPIPLGARRFSIPRSLAILTSYVLIVAVVVFGIYVLVPRLGSQFPEFSAQARVYWNVVGEKLQGWVEYFRSHRMPGPLLDAINSAIPGVFERVSGTVSGAIPSMVGWVAYLPWLVLIPVLSFFLLKDADTFRRSALQMLPRGRWRWRGDEFFQDVNSTLAAYIRAQLSACLFIGVMCALGFTVLGLPSPLVLGVIAGICEFVPLAGPLLVLVLAALAAVLHGGPFSALLVIVFLIVLRIVQDYIVYPRLIGQGIHLHPLAVILAILAGAELAGVAGIFLAIPTVAILTVSYRHWLEHRGSEGIADLLEPTPAPTVPPDELLSTLSDHGAVVTPHHHEAGHPDLYTTPEDMERERPDLTTGELKMPGED